MKYFYGKYLTKPHKVWYNIEKDFILFSPTENASVEAGAFFICKEVKQ